MDSDPKWYTHLEAIKLLKEWSSTLVVIQVGAIAVIGGIYGNIKDHNSLIFIVISLISFIMSIIISANLIGSIPYIVQNFNENYNKYENIYKMRNYFGISILFMSTSVHLLFVLGIITFGIAVYKNIFGI